MSPMWLPNRVPAKGQALRWLVDGQRSSPMLELAQASCGQHPLRIVDVGAAGGPEEELGTIMPFVDVLGFDADQAECERLNRRAAHAQGRVRIEPYVVAGEDSERPFYTCRKRDTSSLLPPDTTFQSAFPDPERVEVVEVAMVRTRHFGRLLTELEVSPEYLKLDVHGVERELLASLSEDQWAGLLAVHTEVLFAPLFVGQGEFGELDATLRAGGLRMIHLRRYSGRRTSVISIAANSRGQLRFGDALYVRNQSDLDPSQRRRLALIMAAFRHYGIALDLLGDDRELRPIVMRLAYRPRTVQALASAMKRVGQLGEALGPRCEPWDTDFYGEWL